MSQNLPNSISEVLSIKGAPIQNVTKTYLYYDHSEKKVHNYKQTNKQKKCSFSLQVYDEQYKVVKNKLNAIAQDYFNGTPSASADDFKKYLKENNKIVLEVPIIYISDSSNENNKLPEDLKVTILNNRAVDLEHNKIINVNQVFNDPEKLKNGCIVYYEDVEKIQDLINDFINNTHFVTKDLVKFIFNMGADDPRKDQMDAIAPNEKRLSTDDLLKILFENRKYNVDLTPAAVKNESNISAAFGNSKKNSVDSISSSKTDDIKSITAKTKDNDSNNENLSKNNEKEITTSLTPDAVKEESISPQKFLDITIMHDNANNNKGKNNTHDPNQIIEFNKNGEFLLESITKKRPKQTHKKSPSRAFMQKLNHPNEKEQKGDNQKNEEIMTAEGDDNFTFENKNPNDINSLLSKDPHSQTPYLVELNALIDKPELNGKLKPLDVISDKKLIKKAEEIYNFYETNNYIKYNFIYDLKDEINEKNIDLLKEQISILDSIKNNKELINLYSEVYDSLFSSGSTNDKYNDYYQIVKVLCESSKNNKSIVMREIISKLLNLELNNRKEMLLIPLKAWVSSEITNPLLDEFKKLFIEWLDKVIKNNNGYCDLFVNSFSRIQALNNKDKAIINLYIEIYELRKNIDQAAQDSKNEEIKSSLEELSKDTLELSNIIAFYNWTFDKIKTRLTPFLEKIKNEFEDLKTVVRKVFYEKVAIVENIDESTNESIPGTRKIFYHNSNETGSNLDKDGEKKFKNNDDSLKSCAENRNLNKHTSKEALNEKHTNNEVVRFPEKLNIIDILDNDNIKNIKAKLLKDTENLIVDINQKIKSLKDHKKVTILKVIVKNLELFLEDSKPETIIQNFSREITNSDKDILKTHRHFHCIQKFFRTTDSEKLLNRYEDIENQKYAHGFF